MHIRKKGVPTVVHIRKRGVPTMGLEQERGIPTMGLEQERGIPTVVHMGREEYTHRCAHEERGVHPPWCTPERDTHHGAHLRRGYPPGC